MTREKIIHCLEPLSGLKDWTHIKNSSGLKNAAVLIPLVEREQWQVLLTKRTDHLHHHPGQISFPGGMADKADKSPLHTVLRETHEEVGIAQELINIAGVIEPYQTVTQFKVVPIVGFVKPSYIATKDDFEVEEVFEVPLAELAITASYQRKKIFWENQWRDYWELEYEGYRIWGATAAMLHALSIRLSGCR
ncbi:MAG: coenzyme A pyrophosphatase [Cycloclasticus sp. symbiont of Poecilosclerida sp. M]|nr:MAG: coenzyme A pyrophosphatase [Cycloclasticus sp. symbiont of Poecilosclerida sp. M]